ncbi:hypothetical protein [Eisenibacter elegans]|jgi:hypothetical protein|uniref:hypothetical protein n=1 Tax=Eisenibacter elegans TaxID=997 RepID=UPI00047C9718|nr:hypothetical protein [Eisenibacter elegans]
MINDFFFRDLRFHYYIAHNTQQAQMSLCFIPYGDTNEQITRSHTRKDALLYELYVWLDEWFEEDRIFDLRPKFALEEGEELEIFEFFIENQQVPKPDISTHIRAHLPKQAQAA